MRHFLITAAAATTLTALLASAPASALENYGPTKVGNQCFTAAPHWGRDLGFGRWAACPQPAGAVVGAKHHRIHHLQEPQRGFAGPLALFAVIASHLLHT